MSWDAVRISLAEGLAWLRGQEVATNAAGTTIEQALLETIVEIDSDQTTGLVEVRDDGTIRPGQLQRVQELRNRFFGFTDENGNPVKGILEQARGLEDPNLAVNPEE